LKKLRSAKKRKKTQKKQEKLHKSGRKDKDNPAKRRQAGAVLMDRSPEPIGTYRSELGRGA
jgi:hypothetical protein